MTTLADFNRLSEVCWEVPRAHRSDMHVPARIYIEAGMLQAILNDKSVDQLVNVATLPGVHAYALAMPDIHQGYGFPVGGVAAVRESDGVISPGGIGYDINCGVRLLLSDFGFAQIAASIPELATQIQRDVPSGTGRGGFLTLDPRELDKVLRDGVNWALRRGYASQADLEATEEHGCFSGADPEFVSAQAKKRGADQLGTIGSGNHFVEIQRVEKILDKELADQFQLFADQVCVMIHTGSRGLGHQTCTDYVRQMNQKLGVYGFELPDRELACAPLDSEDGRSYLKAMACAANFAWVNRQIITAQIRSAFKRVLNQPRAERLTLLYDVSHNIAKRERYFEQKCLVHRKGATRAFGPDNPALAARFQKSGQPVIIPGSMGTASYVLAGTAQAEMQSFGTCCHGAGRALSRTAAKRSLDYEELVHELDRKGVVVRAGSRQGLLEEAPQAYKNVDQVVEVVSKAGIAKTVARLVPLAVVKG